MPAGLTYTPIATTTLGSNTADYTFSSISGSYTDLIVVCSNLTNTTANTLCLRFNGDTGSNYSWTTISAFTSVSSLRTTNDVRGVALGGYIEGLSATTPGTYIGQVMNYSNSSTYKTCIARGSNAANDVEAIVGLWRSTSAITSITVRPSGGLMKTGTVLTLYGIQAA
jgi:hypothetical protein